MKLIKSLSIATALLGAGVIAAQASNPGALMYDFSAGLDGFTGVTLDPGPAGWGYGPSAKTTHAAGGWQMIMTKEFSWGPGGGSANQQLAMQSLAWGDPDTGAEARLAFDIMVDGASFPTNAGVWWQFNLVGNSDGPMGWTQKDKVIEGWQNPDQADLRTWHFDFPFSAVGWQAGDTWFQLWLGANSDGAYPVNFYVDNVFCYTGVVPEPTTLSLVGFGVAALLISRRRK